MKTFYFLPGFVLIAAGLSSLVYPEIRLPVKKEEVQIGPMKVPK